MNWKTRLLVGIGAGAAALGIVAGVRHCLRAMAGSGGSQGADALCQGCSPSGGAEDGGPLEGAGRCHDESALAA